jgi:glutaminyl-peptide cyclotransferase
MLTLCCVIALSVVGACDKVHMPLRPKTAFNGDSALSYARQQVAFGPRVPGTAGAVKAGDWIVQMMKLRADTVIEQHWKFKPAKGDSIPLRNILARFRPQATQRVLYITHWDTRPMADSDPVLGNRFDPIPGANDGASGVGLFIALADQLKKTPPTVGVDLLFVDGEDWGSNWEPPYADVLLGSQHFVNNLPSADYKPM